ncbi:type II secretion system protein M [Fertoebacter nigrum]|uniref:Type II secretion system protein M n=1 Tax=Fertoeibacter niger TaxID=2656921 RepID=A0A8X8GVR0_9RHOB|nr:type II secretion system protein GspM [Fertoeibacter niger]NUB42763.1 type II secretion system protein M [Fertoeibacter niger]
MTRALTDWLALRTPRERLLLGAMLALGLVWLVHAALWQPLAARQAALADRIQRHDRALVLLQSQPARAASAPADTRPLNVIVTETAAAFGLVIRRLEPEGESLRLVLDEAPFDAVILWLEAVERDHGLTLAALDLQRRPAPGVVNASLTLERPAP